MNILLKAKHQSELPIAPNEFLQRFNEITLTKYGTGRDYNYEGKIDFENQTFEL